MAIAQNLSDFDAVLKEFYTERIRSQINNKVKMFRMVEKSGKERWEGNKVVIPLEVNRSWAAGASSGAVLPQARAIQYTRATLTAKTIYGRIRVNADVIKASRSNLGSFARAVGSEIKGMETTLLVSLNRMSFGVGDGKLAEVLSADNAAKTITLRTTGGTGINGNTGARYIRKDMFLVVMAGTAGAGGVRVDSLRVSSVNYSTNVVTLDTSTGAPDLSTTIAGDSVYIAIVAGTSSRNSEIMGIGGIIDDATYVSTLFNVDRSTYQSFKASVGSNSGTNRNLNLDLIQEQLDLVDLASGEQNIKAYICSHGVRREFAKLLQSNKRYTNMKDMGQGFTEGKDEGSMETDIEYSNIPCLPDRDAPYYTMFGVAPESLELFLLQDFEWADEDGAVLRNTPGYDSFEAHIRWLGELGVYQPNQNFVLRDISHTIPVVQWS